MTRQQRVAIFTETFLPRVDGIVNTLRWSARELVAAGRAQAQLRAWPRQVDVLIQHYRVAIGLPSATPTAVKAA